MKRLVVLALVCSSMLILTACGKKDKASKVDSTQILATTDDHTLSTPEKEAIDIDTYEEYLYAKDDDAAEVKRSVRQVYGDIW